MYIARSVSHVETKRSIVETQAVEVSRLTRNYVDEALLNRDSVKIQFLKFTIYEIIDCQFC